MCPQRFTCTRIALPERVDETVAAIVRDNQRDKIEAGNMGQIRLINVSATALEADKVLVCCLLGSER